MIFARPDFVNVLRHQAVRIIENLHYNAGKD